MLCIKEHSHDRHMESSGREVARRRGAESNGRRIACDFNILAGFFRKIWGDAFLDL